MSTGLELYRSVVQSSWQGAILVALILLAQWILGKRLSPGWRYCLWMLLLVRLLVPNSVPAAFSVYNLSRSHRAPDAVWTPAPEALPASQDVPAVERERKTVGPGAELWPTESRGELSPSPPVSTKRPFDWLRFTYRAWLAGVLLFGARLLWGNARFASRIRGHRGVTNAGILQLLEECRAALGVGQKVTLIETDEVASPAVCGFFSKRLLVPDGTFETFSHEELRHIFLHELAHLKRRDLEINWVVSVLRVAHWFNPVLWFAFARLRSDRELAADALALKAARPGDNIAYGETILKVLELLRRGGAIPGLVGIAEDKAQMRARLRAIASAGTRPNWRFAGLILLLALGGLALTDAVEGGKSEPEKGAAAANGPATQQFILNFHDFDDGKPLSDVSVQTQFEYEEAPTQLVVGNTEADGSVTMTFPSVGLPEAPAPAIKRVLMHISKAEYISIEGEWRRQETAQLRGNYRIKLAKGRSISGQVVDEDGAPVANAAILTDHQMKLMLSSQVVESDAGSFLYGFRWTVPPGTPVARTDSNGRWGANFCHPSAQWASLRIRHPDFADTVYSTDTTTAMEAEGNGHALNFAEVADGSAKFVLTPGRSVEGRVVADGQPLSGVQVRYSEVASEYPWEDFLGEKSVTTDADGSFRIPHASDSPLFFAVQHGEFAPAVASITRSEDRVLIELKRGSKIVGRLVDKQGDAVAGASVRLQNWGVWHGVHWQTMTDAEGRFTWEQAPRDKVQFEFEKDGLISFRKNLAPGEHQLPMNRALILSGRITDETGQPIERFMIEWASRAEFFGNPNYSGAIEGTHGRYLIDVGRLYDAGWAGGYPHAFIFRVHADGYENTVSREFTSRGGDVGPVSYDITMKAGAGLVGMVVDAEGKPVASAQVAWKAGHFARGPASLVRLSGKPEFLKIGAAEYPKTDAEGQFRLNRDPDATYLLAVHEKGFAAVEAKTVSTNAVLRLQPWGRVEGNVWEYDQPLKGAEVWLNASLAEDQAMPFVQMQTTSDEKGHYAFDYVPPLKVRVYRMIRMGGGGNSGPQETVVIHSGEDHELKLGGGGRPVTGKFSIKNTYVPIDWRKDFHHATSAYPERPQGVDTPEKFKTWRKSADVEAAFDKVRSYPIIFAEDGSFRINEMPPGKYQFSIRLHDPRDRDAFAYSRYILEYYGGFEVPETPEPNSRTPIDIGTFEVRLKGGPESAAPDFEVSDLDGGRLKLADFRGKYVLLNFWATWCGPCVGEIPFLQQAREKYTKRGDFVILSLSMDKTAEEAKAFVEKNKMPWRHAFIGAIGVNQISNDYGVQGIPANFLISPEGKILGEQMEGPTLLGKLDALMSASAKTEARPR